MSSTSAEYPPSYMNWDDGPRIIRVMTAVTLLATLFVALRIGVRLHRRLGLALDDWLIIVALVVEWAEYADGYLCIERGGIGLHLPIALERKPNPIRNTFLYMFAGELIFFTGLALIKWSVLAMYYRLFPTRFMKWGYCILGAMNGAWWIAVAITTIFQCTPIHKYWDTTVSGTCINANVFYISTNGVPNIVLDAAILCLPIYEVYKLQISRKMKLAVAANFLVGSIVIVASIIKLTVMVHLYHLGATADITYELAGLLIWVEVEPCMGIMSACLPTLRPILMFLLRQTGLAKNASEGRITPGLSSLITFGGGGGGGVSGRNKRRGYGSTLGLENEQGSTEHLGNVVADVEMNGMNLYSITQTKSVVVVEGEPMWTQPQAEKVWTQPQDWGQPQEWGQPYSSSQAWSPARTT